LNGIVEEITDRYNECKKIDSAAAYLATVEKYDERVMKDWTYPPKPAVPKLLDAVTRSENRHSNLGPSSTASDVAREELPVPPKRRRVYDPNSRKMTNSFKAPMRQKIPLNIKIVCGMGGKKKKKTLKTLNRQEGDAFENVTEDTSTVTRVVSDDESAVSLPPDFNLASIPIDDVDDVVDNVVDDTLDDVVQYSFITRSESVPSEVLNSSDIVDSNTGVVVTVKSFHRKKPTL
jgi:hypothetical protein